MKIEPVCGYIGGKYRWSHKIVPILMKAPNNPKNYYEIFSGMAGVLISKPKHHIEVINDIDSNIYAFWRCMIDQELFKQLNQIAMFDVHSVELYHWMRDMEVDENDLVMKAYRTFHVLKHSFGSQGRTWSRKVIRQGPTWPAEVAVKLHKRMARVSVEHLDYEKFIKAYDRSFAVAYIDPPYVIATEKKHYNHNFTMEDHRKLAKILKDVEMSWVLSYDSHPLIHELYKDFNINTINIAYGTFDSRPHGNKTPHTQELLITNYNYPKQISLEKFL